MERLQKVIAQSGLASRREAEELILAGRVKVNGEIITTLGVKVSDLILLRLMMSLLSAKKIYILMNKPRGIITSTEMKNRKTVISILPENIKISFVSVGRLDYDTKGALLLTNDELVNGLIGPRSNVEKEYLARIEGLLHE